MSQYCRTCTCPEGSDIMTARVEQTLPDDHVGMDPSFAYLLSVIKCAHCGAVLKSAGTVVVEGIERTVPLPGRIR